LLAGALLKPASGEIIPKRACEESRYLVKAETREE